MIPKQPELSAKLKAAIAGRPLYIIGAEYGVSPAALHNYLNRGLGPRQMRTITAIEKILKGGE